MLLVGLKNIYILTVIVLFLNGCNNDFQAEKIEDRFNIFSDIENINVLNDVFLPKIEDIYKGVNIIKQHRPDFIISIGGGSVIDMGKLINILANQKIYSILDIIMNSNCH